MPSATLVYGIQLFSLSVGASKDMGMILGQCVSVTAIEPHGHLCFWDVLIAMSFIYNINPKQESFFNIIF